MFAVNLIQPKTGILRWLNIVFDARYFRRLFVCLFTISAGKVDPDDLSCSVGHDFSTFASLSPAQQALDMAAAREAIDSCSLAHHFTLLLLLTGMFVL